ncbi:helix-turn-helix domain-containing protein [Anaerocolumna xylanovorans]|uniref:Transcriptional regulator, contains XRE-family HTH domain n=1 Tax=Anaerocolumna xylanovorans DSM 12503 TaxID=1121345 RepID=A0A1M7YHJ3_9FIRM|nr:helix-turn-helix transcriptional regulator [Anaerocolumna xylanovorans]SHO51998.1 Transcriptional regulator, contains XRE-family HTH domain [Anaerocolumna xylanovorans DSM 12503]
MDTINIGKIISDKRKEKGITQEGLANYLGVSKPAVSKWESGQSYPDILLLPVLAAYFDISVDELIGYEPKMTKEDVRKLYHRLAAEFAKEPFDKVYGECEGYLKKYFSCWYLQYQIGLLYLNHCALAGSPDRNEKVLQRAVEVFESVEHSSDDVSLAKQAMQIKAYCYICQQKPAEAIEVLERLSEPVIQSEALLIKAYQLKGDKKKAIEYLQGYTCTSLNALLGTAADFFQLYADQPDRMDQYYDIYIKLIDIFEIEQLFSGGLYTIYLVAASVYVIQERNEKALDVLDRYVDLAKRNARKDFTLHGSRIFDSLDEYLKTIDVETLAPRSPEVIWRDIKNIVSDNPAFRPLEKEARFQKIKRSLQELLSQKDE